MMLDPDGQPVNLAWNRARRTERDICELLGLAKGLLADGMVTEAESALLRDWIGRHPDAYDYWPINTLYQRLERAFADGTIDEAERLDLAELLECLVGGKAGVIAGADAATELPLDRPPPKIMWPASIFVFTGKFAFGPRKACERQVHNLGGQCEVSVTQRTNYLIVGTFGSRDWVHTSFGRKIEKAVTYKRAGQRLAIISEDHWAGSLA
jgi:BRCA1 C Terminus (BRCT) domain